MDREERDEYTLILTASDLGSPPQQTSRLLKVVVKDIDDHQPTFNRQRVRARSLRQSLKKCSLLPRVTGRTTVFCKSLW